MKKIFFLSSYLLGTMLIAQTTPEDIVKASLEAYNTQQIDKFMSYFSEDIEMREFENTDVITKGLKEVRAIFEPFFNASPDLHSHIVNRITIGNKVMDLESVTGARGNKEAFEIVVIYEIEEDKIKRMTMIREPK